MANEPYMGAVFLFAGNFAPRGYAFCQGQLMSIAQNSALFSILGTTFGGDGQQTFGLPDLRGRAPIGAGQGPGLNPVQLGDIAGNSNVAILTSNLPPHNHLINVNTNLGSQSTPANNYPAVVSADGSTGIGAYETSATGNTLNPQAVTVTGSGVPINVQNPYLGLNYIIATEGIYPSRN